MVMYLTMECLGTKTVTITKQCLLRLSTLVNQTFLDYHKILKETPPSPLERKRNYYNQNLIIMGERFDFWRKIGRGVAFGILLVSVFSILSLSVSNSDNQQFVIENEV